MIVRTPQAAIDAYFADTEHISQGKLKKLLKGVDIYNKDDNERELYYEEKEHLNIGNAVDVLLTQGQQSFDEQFAILMIEKPGDKLMSVVQFIFDRFIQDKDIDQIRHSSLSMSVAPDEILDAASAEAYQPKWKDETMITNVNRDAGDYFDALCMNHGKQLLDSEEAVTINAIVESLNTNTLTKDFFNPEVIETMNIDVYYQHPIYFTVSDIPCKALLDIMLVDHHNKWFAPYDLKTMADYTVNFHKSVMRHRYDIQAAFYTEAVIQEMKNNSSLPYQQSLRDRESFDGYSNAPFRFIVESGKVQNNPLVFEVDSELLQMGSIGRPEGYTLIHNEDNSSSNQIYHQPVHGFWYALELYKWHLENGFEKDRNVVQNQGLMKLGWNRSY